MNDTQLTEQGFTQYQAAEQVGNRASEQTNNQSGGDQPVAAQPKPRVVNAKVQDGRVTIMHASFSEPLIEFDPSQLTGKTHDSVLAYGAAVLLRQAANSADPQKSVNDMAQRLVNGQWQPGRRGVDREIEPIVAALAQHLNKDPQFVVETYLPKYCERVGLVTANGRNRIADAKTQLEKHKDIAPLVSRIIAQRSKEAGKGQEALDLSAIAAE